MLIDCPRCARSYPISRSDLGDRGRSVMCPHCSMCWSVDADGIERERRERSADPVGRLNIVRRRALGSGRSRFVAGALAACVLAAFGTGAVAARDQVIHLLPRTSGLYARLGLSTDQNGLRLSGLSPVRLASGDIGLSGTIRNVTTRAIALPRLRFEVRDAGGTVLMTWRERAPGRRLAAGRRAVFKASPHHLPPDARGVSVRFVDDSEPRDGGLEIADLR